MDKKDANRERQGTNLPPDTDTTGTNEEGWRETVEDVRNREAQPMHPGGQNRGLYSEGTREGRARSLRRSHRSGRVADELGGMRGKTK